MLINNLFKIYEFGDDFFLSLTFPFVCSQIKFKGSLKVNSHDV